jgi:hypothetical protein
MNEKNDYPKPQQDQIRSLLILLAITGLIILAALHIWFSIQSGSPGSMTVQQALMKLFSDALAGIVGALISYLFIYFVFIKQGITIDINPQQLEGIKQNLKQDITATSGEMIRGLIDNMKRVGDSDLKLYTFCGLQSEVSQDSFQDFNIAGENKNAIHFFWADLSTPSPSEIRARIDKAGKFLHVSFNNHSIAGSNIAIRPSGDNARIRDNRMRYLAFDMRISKGNEDVEVGFRVVNGWLQHWFYSYGETEGFIKIKLRPHCMIEPGQDISDWKSFSLDLENHQKWKLFKSDGNYRYSPREADFNYISFVIFEFGCSQGNEESALAQRPGSGSGELDIRNIRLEENPVGHAL